MFESICVPRTRKLDIDSPLDLGLIGECLLFYGSVNVILERGTLRHLLASFDMDQFFGLLESDVLRLHYLNGGVGVRSDKTGVGAETHVPIVWSVPAWSVERDAHEVFREVTGQSGRGRRLANRYLKAVSPIELDASEVTGYASDDFVQHDYVAHAVEVQLGILAPEYVLPASWHFEILKDGDVFRVGTNLDWSKIDASYRLHDLHPDNHLTPAHLLSQIAGVRGELDLASQLGSELATDPVSSAIMQSKFEALVDQRSELEELFLDFQERTLSAGSVREAINSGRKTLGDLVPVVQNAEKFKGWLQKRDDPFDVIPDYFEAVAAKSWISTTPAKLLRWGVLFGVGFATAPIGALTAGALALGDMMLLDRLSQGWRPNRFIDSSLKRFLEG
jgi:hypothetical protein